MSQISLLFQIARKTSRGVPVVLALTISGCTMYHPSAFNPTYRTDQLISWDEMVMRLRNCEVESVLFGGPYNIYELTHRFRARPPPSC
ncbi:MAG: hypothetical protein P8X50_02905 [Maritimibacter sp.]